MKNMNYHILSTTLIENNEREQLYLDSSVVVCDKDIEYVQEQFYDLYRAYLQDADWEVKDRSCKEFGNEKTIYCFYAVKATKYGKETHKLSITHTLRF